MELRLKFKLKIMKPFYEIAMEFSQYNCFNMLS
jgi:hypothetical protein